RADPGLRDRRQCGAWFARAGAAPALVPVVAERNRGLDSVLLAGGVWLAWLLLFQWAGPEALSPPGATLRRAGEYLASATFWPHAAATAGAFAYAWLIALTGGLALGFALGPHRRGGRVGEPILSSLYSIPKITLY